MVVILRACLIRTFADQMNPGLSLDVMPGRMGVPSDVTSGYEKFEAPDPAEWTARGYAVVNVDSRGAWDSEGYLWSVIKWHPSCLCLLL
jgi:predicted acyl esterase